MVLKRLFRRCLAALMAVVLLHVQLAVAAHACPVPLQAAAETESMPDCGLPGHGQPSPDTDSAPLCQAHCDPGGQSPQSGAASLLAADAAPLPVLLWVLPQVDLPANLEAPAYAPANGPPRGAPPLYLSLLVLRN